MLVFSVAAAVVSALWSGPADAEATGIEAFRAVFAPGTSGRLDNLRAMRYIARFDEEITRLADEFDFDKGLVNLSGAMPPPEVAELDRHERKRYAGMSEYVWLYRLGRVSASHIGNLALAWALPESRHYKNERFREGVINGLQAYIEHQLPTGEFAFSSIRTSSCYGTHEMAWRLEPLLAAYLCVRHTLPAEQAARFREGLAKAADYLYENVNTSQSNRGCVWCGVMATAARVFERPEYLERIRENWAWVGRRVLAENGMVVEGPGPDFCYSYVTFLYAFRHRIGRGESALDKPLLRSLDWLSTMHDSQGLPMQAISTRTGRFSPNSLAYLLGALEYYARERPYCTTLAADYLAVLERQSGSVAIDHGGIPWITAALFHDPSIVLTPLPDRLARFADYGNYDITSYFNVRRDYHTLLVFSGVKDWSGLQHWCLAGERPLLCEFEGGGASGLRTWAIDTARLNIENRFSMDRSDLQTACIDWGGVMTCYVFGESATWIVNAAPGRKREVRWAMNRATCAPPAVDGNVITTESQRSRMEMGPVAPAIAEAGRGWLITAELPDTEAVDWTILHDGGASITGVCFEEDLVSAELSDRSGHYMLWFNAGQAALELNGTALRPRQVRIVRSSNS